MQRALTFTISDQAKAYFQLIKPGIIMGNAITAAGGFALASKADVDFGLFLTMLAGLSLIIASACVFNNYIDRDIDLKMLRTQNRPLGNGRISSQSAILFGIVLGFLGIVLLTLLVNLLTMGIAVVGWVVYVFLYSFLKYRSVHATLIGSIAGAAPPVVGYCAISNRLDMGALLIFIIVTLWQMPHFYAIAIYRLEEYAAATIPVLPLKKGVFATKVQMLCYIAAFSISSWMLSIFNYTGMCFTITVSIVSMSWLWMSIQGFRAADDRLWARKMFIFSLIAITTICAVIPFCLVND